MVGKAPAYIAARLRISEKDFVVDHAQSLGFNVGDSWRFHSEKGLENCQCGCADWRNIIYVNLPPVFANSNCHIFNVNQQLCPYLNEAELNIQVWKSVLVRCPGQNRRRSWHDLRLFADQPWFKRLSPEDILKKIDRKKYHWISLRTSWMNLETFSKLTAFWLFESSAHDALLPWLILLNQQWPGSVQ